MIARQLAALLIVVAGLLPAGVAAQDGFSVRLWVRASGPLAGHAAIAASKAWDGGEVVDFTSNSNLGRSLSTGSLEGWAIATQPNGSWAWNLGDGSRRLDYLPTVGRQPIADGEWHQLGFALDRDAGVARLYHDGREVAIYDVSGLKAASPGELSLPASEAFEVEGVTLEGRAFGGAEFAADWQARTGAAVASPPRAGDDLTVLAWNIWHGGRRDGEVDGLRRVVETIEQSGADVVAMQETYGSGPRIADALGWSFYLRSSNISVLSRFPIVETHAIFAPFHCGGVTLDLGGGRRVAVMSLWIRHLPDYGDAAAGGATPAELVAAEGPTRHREIKAILSDLAPLLRRRDQTPVIVAGDFNSPSHLDWTARVAEKNHGLVVRWPVSMAMARAGFVDVYRRIHPDPAARPGRTWSPRFTETRQDRIDYVFAAGEGIYPADAAMIDGHPEGWPSDHSAVRARFGFGPSHESRTVEGFELLVDRVLLAESPGLAAETLKQVAMQLYSVQRVVPAGPLARLREVPIWINRRSGTRCMAYHPSPVWLRDHGFDPAMAKAVELGDPKAFLSWTRAQPWMVMHELAHAYHDRVLGFDHAGIRSAFERARSGGGWETVLHVNGRDVEPYAMTNHKEFFAEITEAWFGTNDMFPFVRAELERHAPESAALLKKLWR